MLPKLEHVLYCTDLSKNASYAFKYAAKLAQDTGAQIHVLHVVEKLSNDAKLALRTYVMNEKSRDEMLNHRLEHAQELLKERQDYFWDFMVLPEEREIRKKISSIDIVEHYPAETILRRSEELKADLIIMGAHEKGIMHTFLGSVAKSVLRRSRIPTMIVPLPEKTELKRQKEARMKRNKKLKA